MGYKGAKEQLISGRSALRNHSMNQRTLRDSIENDGDGEYISRKQKKTKNIKPRPDSDEAIEQRRVDRVVAAANYPRIAEALKDIILEDVEAISLSREAIVFGIIY